MKTIEKVLVINARVSEEVKKEFHHDDWSAYRLTRGQFISTSGETRVEEYETIFQLNLA